MFFDINSHPSKFNPRHSVFLDSGIFYFYTNDLKFVLILEGQNHQGNFYFASEIYIRTYHSKHFADLMIKPKEYFKLEDMNRILKGLKSIYSRFVSFEELKTLQTVFQTKIASTTLRNPSREQYLDAIFLHHQDQFSQEVYQDLLEVITNTCVTN